MQIQDLSNDSDQVSYVSLTAICAAVAQLRSQSPAQTNSLLVQSADTQAALHTLLAGGIMCLFGMMIATVTPIADYNLANTNSFLKQVCLGIAIFGGFIGVIILWAHGDLCTLCARSLHLLVASPQSPVPSPQSPVPSF